MNALLNSRLLPRVNYAYYAARHLNRAGVFCFPRETLAPYYGASHLHNFLMQLTVVRIEFEFHRSSIIMNFFLYQQSCKESLILVVLNC
jgi:hypothetical protein